MAFLGYILLPNYPTNTPWLSETESALAQYRLSREADGEKDEVNESVLLGLKDCLTDPKAWLLVLILTGAVVGMSFTCKSLTCRNASKPTWIRIFTREFHRFLPINRPDPRLPQCGDASSNLSSLLLRLHLLHRKFLAQRQDEGALLPHSRLLRHLNHRADSLHVHLQRWRPLLRTL